MELLGKILVAERASTLLLVLLRCQSYWRRPRVSWWVADLEYCASTSV